MSMLPQLQNKRSPTLTQTGSEHYHWRSYELCVLIHSWEDRILQPLFVADAQIMQIFSIQV